MERRFGEAVSIISSPINESEQAGEKLADHIGSQLSTQAPAFVAAALELLAGRKVVITISLESK